MKGILLLNLGTPDAPTTQAVREYLDVFLSDPYVITLPSWLRTILVQKIILPTRSKQSSHAYQQIWTSAGSPLLVNSEALRHAISDTLGDEYFVVLGMRYGNPSIESAIDKLQKKGCSHVMVLPLFPQWADATSRSAIEAAKHVFNTKHYFPSIDWIHDFYQQDFYIQSVATLLKAALNNKPDDFVLLSYHGLPVNHLKKSDCANQKRCAIDQSCPIPALNQTDCYRSQCFVSSRLIAKQLSLSTNHYATTFQSRLGMTKWIGPYTDRILPDLIEKNIVNLTVACPSFVADCLETLEEINIRLRTQWLSLGGNTFQLVSCLNAHPHWITAVSQWIKNRNF